MTSLPVTLGHDGSGSPVVFDVRKGPHLLIAGTTGSGKSVAIHAIVTDLLASCGPWECGLVLIDPKRVELADYVGLPHVCGPAGTGVVYCDPVESIGALEWLLRQTQDRFAMMESVGARDVSAVPWSALESHGQPRHIVLVVDELADLMMTSSVLNRTERARITDPEITLARVLQIGRAAGVHAILATQRPSSDIVSGVIKANVPTRLVFALQNAIDSRVAMGRKGAEELNGAGEALFLPVGQRNPIRLQGRMVSDNERKAIVDRCLPAIERTSRPVSYDQWLTRTGKRSWRVT